MCIINRYRNCCIQSYENIKKGVVSLIDWIELPKSTEVDPNKSLYRLGHSLAHNDCLMRSRAKFVALVDIDEIIVPSTRNQSLLDFLKASLKTHPLAGSFLFKHARLRFPAAKIKPETDLAHLDFRWLLSATADLKNGPAKVIFMSERADVVLTHRVRFHRKPFSEVENWFNEDLRREVVRSYNKIIGNIKDPGLLKTSLYSKSPHLLRQCIDNWKNRSGCKTPFRSCFSSLSSMEEWVYSNNNPNE
uniref:Glycosyltransferase family 92 protein n=1 Tax=Acrobeloides nanus TaxID=290746 RepID=A0A914DII8_9BILA